MYVLVQRLPQYFCLSNSLFVSSIILHSFEALGVYKTIIIIATFCYYHNNFHRTLVDNIRLTLTHIESYWNEHQRELSMFKSSNSVYWNVLLWFVWLWQIYMIFLCLHSLNACHFQRISSWTKWQPFRIRYFRGILYNEKFCILIELSLKFAFRRVQLTIT